MTPFTYFPTKVIFNPVNLKYISIPFISSILLTMAYSLKRKIILQKKAQYEIRFYIPGSEIPMTADMNDDYKITENPALQPNH
jgi:hypothetical protein